MRTFRLACRAGGVVFLALCCAPLLLNACATTAGDPPTDNPIDDDDNKNTGGRSGDDPILTGGTVFIDPVEGEGGANPCLGPNPPDNCHMEPTGPACGDGEINQDTEECDDGNALPGDGCTGICKVEPNWKCTEPNTPCTPTFACGNGKIEPGEVCDDGNDVGDDGCSADCTEQSRNFVCAEAGQPCTRIVSCGDGRVAGEESCEDGNTVPEDGCDANCNVEPGWICRTVGAPCEPSPACGDRVVTPSIGEACDDGNRQGGDGCAEDCSFVEGGYVCSTPGEPCTNLNVCGDGDVTGAEACDDGNDTPGDGCSNCALEPGYECPFEGAPCLPKCGDGIVLDSMEICDDGNLENNDGCSSLCEWEDGFACTGDPPDYHCQPTVCGNGVREGTESCDDGNTNLGDGCTPLCDVEPACTTSGCTSTCGDGIVLGSEVCDDGNNRNGDGCSEECTVEPGSDCEQPELGESLEVPVVYRDFPESNPDFQVGIEGCEEANVGMVEGTLDNEGKPVLLRGGEDCRHTTTAQSFATWYRDTPGTNATVVGTLTLWDDGAGNYVNRWGDDGERWQIENPSGLTWCADAGGTCADCDFEYSECYNPCTPWGATNDQVCADGTGGYETFEGNPTFFPIDGQGMPSHADYDTALIPEPVYRGGWQDEPGGALHNFHFTSEVRFWFEYDPAASPVLDFTGDDDVWVFINDKLAVDLGGIHVPVSGAVDLNDAATRLGLTPGVVYEIVVFQAEREKHGSSYRLTLSGFNVAPSKCGPICGDGILSPGEACDDGVLAGGYNACNPDCTRGEYCGDGELQAEFEECDNGVNADGYGESGCAPGCRAVPYCGDGVMQGEFGERCDDGVNDGARNGCTPECQRAPYCGDGNVDPEEQCDDGLNNGAYNTCAPDCVLGPRCGDGVFAPEWGEACDDGNLEGGDGCSPNCTEEGICGDTLVDRPAEECDDGVNDGGYGECAPGCVLGPRCGDGVVQEEEVCDDGVNAGGYGECAPGCVLGPHCGDGTEQPGYEECDDGNDRTQDGCSPACKIEIPVPR